MKDLASIYHDCDDYRIVVWNPIEQRHMNITFTGSDNVNKQVNFNVDYTDGYHHWKWDLLMFKMKIKSKWNKWSNQWYNRLTGK